MRAIRLVVLPVIVTVLLTGCDLPEHSARAATSDDPAPTDPTLVTVTETNSDPASLPVDALFAPTNSAPVPQTPANLPDAAREVVTLALSLVEDGVLTNFIATLKEPFQLDADQIIYLRDVGLSTAVIESLLARQKQIETENKAQSVAAQVPTTSPPPVASTPPPTPPAEPDSPTAYPGSIPPLTPPQVGPAESVAAPDTTPAETVNNFNFFYDSLAPYGNWVTVPTFGMVWQPTCAVVTPGWRPYWNNGSWVWSDRGWYWNSFYSWGWAPFHYGNWCNTPGFGWCWVPGRTWGPSWVTFRYSRGFCGWAPLPPGCGWRSGVGLTFAGSGVGVSFGFGFSAANYCWTPTSCFTARNCSAFGVSRSQAVQIYKDSTVINNYVVGNNNTIINGGINPGDVQKHSRNEIRKVQLADAASPGTALGRPGQAGQLGVYRPTVTEGSRAASTTRLARSEVRPTQLASNSGLSSDRTRLPLRANSAPSREESMPRVTTPRVDFPAGSPNPLGSPVRLLDRSNGVRPGTSANLPTRGATVPSGTAAPGSAPGAAPTTGAPRSVGRQPAVRYTGQTTPSTPAQTRLEPRKQVTAHDRTGSLQADSGSPVAARINPRANYGGNSAQNVQGPARVPPSTFNRNISRPQGVPTSAAPVSRPPTSPTGRSINSTPRGSYSAGSSVRSAPRPQVSSSPSRPSNSGGGNAIRPR